MDDDGRSECVADESDRECRPDARRRAVPFLERHGAGRKPEEGP